MTRRVKDHVEVADHLSIDGLIKELTAIRDGLPEDCEAELCLRGDDVFGRRITISYFRPQTSEEAAVEERYLADARKMKERELERLQAELVASRRAAAPRRGTLRIVA